MYRVLVVDDEIEILKALEIILSNKDYDLQFVRTLKEARRSLSEFQPSSAIVDVKLPDGKGTDLLNDIASMPIPLPIIFISGHATLSEAADATRRGAFDFLEKPLDRNKIIITLRNSCQQWDLMKGQYKKPSDIIAVSPNTKEAIRVAIMAAKGNAPILISGETGTGKEVFANLIHDESDRHDKPFIAINCAAIPSELLESELFGHVKGAFTGATSNNLGKVLSAEGGILFLDEIGDLPLSAQAKFLRVLENGEVTPIGGNRSLKANIRVITATNKDIKSMIKEGQFREDLYYRIAAVTLKLPSLRERKEDIIPLAKLFIKIIGAQCGKRDIIMHQSFERALMSYSWPGNIREIRNAIERSILLSQSRVLSIESLPSELFPAQSIIRKNDSEREKEEREILEEALLKHKWHITATAKELGMSRSGLYKRLKKFGLMKIMPIKKYD